MKKKQFKKTIDEIYITLEDKIPKIYPMKIYRCLKRYDLATLPSDFVDTERRIKKFRKYGVGYLHIDLLYAPKINKERKGNISIPLLIEYVRLPILCLVKLKTKRPKQNS